MRRARQLTPVFLPGESHGQRSLMGCNPWGRTESDMTEVTYDMYIYTYRKYSEKMPAVMIRVYL